MFRSARDQALRTFSDQFDTAGPRIVYRQHHRRAPIPVSAEERDGFVAAFDRAYRLLLWGFTISMLLVMSALVGLSIAAGRSLSPVHIVLATALMSSLLFGLTWWIWNAPARALAGRMPSGKPYSEVEVQRRAFARMPYRNFLIATGAICVLYVQLTGGRDLLAGWNLLWSVLAMAGLIGVGFQVYRKWSVGKSDADLRR